MLQGLQARQRRFVAFVEHPIDREPLSEDIGLPFGGHREGVGFAPGSGVAGRSAEAAAGFSDGDHRFDDVQDVALDEEALARLQGRGDREQQGGLQDPALVVLLLEPGIGELDRDQIQLSGLQGLQPGTRADVGVAEEVVEVAQAELLTVGFRGADQGAPDLNAEVVDLGLLLGERQQKATPRAADIQVHRQAWITEQVLGRGQLQRQLEEAAQWVDVLAHHRKSGSVRHQKAPARGVAMQVGCTGDRADFAVAKGTADGHRREVLTASIDIAIGAPLLSFKAMPDTKRSITAIAYSS